jgi:hypothetical protein
MTKWDYKTVVLTGGFMGRHKEELKRQDLEKEFDALGQDGWELSWILMNQTLQGEKDGHVRYLQASAARVGRASEVASLAQPLTGRRRLGG